MSMQSNLADLIIESILADDDASPAEEITYTPATGTARTVRALVLRRQTADYGNSVAPVLSVSVANDATSGISSTEINVGSDTITVAERPGATAVARNMGRLLTINSAYMTIELR